MAALVRAYGLVELHAVAEVGLHFAAVVDPCNAERQDAVRFHHALDDFRLFKFGVLVVDVSHAQEHFAHCLEVFFFAGVLGFKVA